MVENIIIGVVVILAIFFILRTVFQRLAGKGNVNPCHGCSGCSLGQGETDEHCGSVEPKETNTR